MEISVFGLGYVGCISSGCLTKMGHNVIGVDINEHKVNLINEGKPTIIEKDIDALIQEGKEKGLLRGTTDIQLAVDESDLSIIAVGTPSSAEGHLNLDYIYSVAADIGCALRNKNKFHIIAIRSTVLPGTNKKVGEIIEKHSGKKRNLNFTVVSNPEFLREGTAVNDYFNPPLTLIGYDHDYARDYMKTLYADIKGEIVTTEIKVAEIMKYVNNTYHALKIVFGNEVGNVCKKLGIDSHEVMNIFCKDRQLNISPYYFKPGFAYGGSCLPKDTKALTTLASDLYINVPVISSIERSNALQKEHALNMIINKNKRNIAILGLSFKAGTDDLRNSPIVDVVERLLGKGYRIKIYDKNVKLSDLTGTNREYIESKIPHLQSLISDDMEAVIEASDVIIIANKEEEFKDIVNHHQNKVIIDLVRMWQDLSYEGDYEGICWGDNLNRDDASKAAGERDRSTKEII